MLPWDPQSRHPALSPGHRWVPWRSTRVSPAQALDLSQDAPGRFQLLSPTLQSGDQPRTVLSKPLTHRTREPNSTVVDATRLGCLLHSSRWLGQRERNHAFEIWFWAAVSKHPLCCLKDRRKASVTQHSAGPEEPGAQGSGPLLGWCWCGDKGPTAYKTLD